MILVTIHLYICLDKHEKQYPLCHSLEYKFCLLQLSIIFIDMEGTSVQELSAIQMNAETQQIIDVYHAHACSSHLDSWARKHIHGLNPVFLSKNGFPNEDSLIANFKQWLSGKMC